MKVDKRYGSQAGKRRVRRASPAEPAQTISYMQNRLFDLMNAQRLTQANAAHAMRKHPVTLSYWRVGKHEMRATDIESMADVLGYKWELVKRDD